MLRRRTHSAGAAFAQPIGAYLIDYAGEFYSFYNGGYTYVQNIRTLAVYGSNNIKYFGVYCWDGVHDAIIYSCDIQLMMKWSTGTSKLISGVMATTSSATAITDYAGENNSALVISQMSTKPIFTAANSYSKGNVPAGKWYIPAMGELNLLTNYSNTSSGAIPAAMFYLSTGANLGNSLGLSYVLYSSTQYNTTNAWTFRFDTFARSHTYKNAVLSSGQYSMPITKYNYFLQYL